MRREVDMLGISSGGDSVGIHIYKSPPSYALTIHYFFYVNDIPEMFGNDPGPSLAHVFCGTYMIGILKYPDLTQGCMALRLT